MEVYQVRLTKDAEKAILKIDQSLPAIGSKISAQIGALKMNPHLGSKLFKVLIRKPAESALVITASSMRFMKNIL